MGKQGFTLIELLITIVIIGLIMGLILPSASRMSRDNQNRLYLEYENMMVEYAKINPRKSQNIICLRNLDELHAVKRDCHGYVEINHTVMPEEYVAYVTCNGVYSSHGYNPAKEICYDGENVLTIIANDQTISYGSSIANGIGQVTVSGLKQGHSIQSIELSANTTAATTDGSITPSEAIIYDQDNNNVTNSYTINYVSGRLVINRIKCNPPTNVMVSSNGLVTWTPSSNCPTAQHQVRVGNNSFADASSGVDRKSSITANAGEVIVKVRALSPGSNYNNSEEEAVAVNVYSVNLTKGSGISSVIGSGNYIEGANVTISAVANSGYLFKSWTVTGSSPIETVSNVSEYIISNISSNINYTANSNDIWAENISYNNDISGLNCTDTQCAVDKINEKLS